MKNVGKILSSASGVFGLIPGIAVMITELGVPPNTSKVLFAATIESLGALAILILWLNKNKIKKLSTQAVTKYTVALSIIFIVSFFSYILFFGFFVVEVPNSESLLFPFWPQNELKEGLTEFGSKAELIRNWGRDDVYKMIQRSSSVALQFTKIIFLTVYIAIFICLTLAFGILGIALSETKTKTP